MQICLQFSQPRCQRSQFFFLFFFNFLPICFANDKRVFLEKKKKKKKERKKERESTSDGNWAQSLSQMKMAFWCMNCRRLFWTHSINIASIISIPLYSSSCSFFFFKNQQKTNTKTKTHQIWRINPMCDFDFCPTSTARNNVSLSLCSVCLCVLCLCLSESVKKVFKIRNFGKEQWGKIFRAQS